MLTEIDVWAILGRAVRAAKLIQGPKRPGYANVWVVMMQQAMIRDEYPETPEPRDYATPEEIAALDIAHGWMVHMSEPERCILWGRADGDSWRHLARKVGLTPHLVQKAARQAVGKIQLL